MRPRGIPKRSVIGVAAGITNYCTLSNISHRTAHSCLCTVPKKETAPLWRANLNPVNKAITCTVFNIPIERRMDRRAGLCADVNSSVELTCRTARITLSKR